MSAYKFFIYKIDWQATAVGEYVGPFATERERDEAARQMREKVKGARARSVYRANVNAELAATLATPSIAAA